MMNEFKEEYAERERERERKNAPEYKTQQDVCGNGNMVWQRFTLEIK